MKSPIKDKPLRNPGQSLDWRIPDVASWLKQIIKESIGEDVGLVGLHLSRFVRAAG